jgi:hypothetical protein
MCACVTKDRRPEVKGRGERERSYETGWDDSVIYIYGSGIASAGNRFGPAVRPAILRIAGVRVRLQLRVLWGAVLSCI